MTSMRTAILSLLLSPGLVFATGHFDFETGMAANTYNEVQISQSTGTRFSISDDLDVASMAFWRARLSWSISADRRVEILAAPLEFKASGSAPAEILFDGRRFEAGTPLQATYRFDSYRISYLQSIRDSEALSLELGFTAKLRDAEIAISSSGLSASKDNRGFVPLLAFRMAWRMNPSWALRIEADALAAPQGRAEDVLLALEHRLGDRLDLRGGYRFVEGGADVEDVYNFAFIHYASLGLRVRI